MTGYVLNYCSAADLSKEHSETRIMSFICSRYEVDGKQYADNPETPASFPEFYRSMKEGAFSHPVGRIETNSIGTVIGSHSVPGTAALFFRRKNR